MLHFPPSLLRSTALIAASLVACGSALAQATFPGIGREIHFYGTKNPKDGECAGLYLRVKEIARYVERARAVHGLWRAPGRHLGRGRPASRLRPARRGGHRRIAYHRRLCAL